MSPPAAIPRSLESPSAAGRPCIPCQLRHRVPGSQIVDAPDGNLWFLGSYGSIDMFNPTTQLTTQFPLPGGNTSERGIALGPDGNIWFTDSGDAVGTINLTTHAITEFPLPTPAAGAMAIAAGPDGNVWFIEVLADKLGSINPSDSRHLFGILHRARPGLGEATSRGHHGAGPTANI